MQRQTRHGIILPLAISMMFAMMILALALIQQEQSNTTYTFIDEVEGLEDQQAEAGFSTMQAIFQGQAEGNPNLLVSETSMFNAPGPFGTFHGPVPAPSPPPPTAVQLLGDFTLAAKPSVQSLFNNPNIGFDFNQVGGSAIPQRYARVVETAQLPNQTTKSGLFMAPSQSYYSVYSPSYPYGMLAFDGNLRVRDAFAVSDPTFKGQAIGLPVNLFGSLAVLVSNYLNGHAWVNKSSATVQLLGAAGVGGGVAHLLAEPPVFPPADFQASLTKALTTLPSAPSVSVNLSTLLSALSSPITLAIDGAGLSGSGKLLQGVLSVSGGALVVANNFQAAPGASTVIPVSLVVNGNLLVPDRSILVVQGSLQVHGDLVLGQQSTLRVEGAVQVTGHLGLTGPATGGLNTSILAEGAVTITQGSAHVVVSGFSPVGSLFSENVNSISQLLGIPPVLTVVNLADITAAGSALSLANGAISGLTPLIGSFTVTVDTPDPAPGAFIVSQGGSGITLVDTSNPSVGTNQAGWLVSEGGSVVLSVSGPGTCTGMVWADTSIQADDTSFHEFPYYSAADVLTSTSPPSSTQVAAFRYTRTAWGKLP
ncbi:MAG TPA: hypothetical protein VGO93_06110 [Candidatus Xenobia bacterium]|jgi:hypothetical protein